MALDWQPFVELISRHQRILMTTHIRPDGDGLGSMLALDEALRQFGKSVQLVVASVLPARYHFLDPGKRIHRFEQPGDDFRQNDLVLVLDTGTWNQLGDFGPYLRALPAAKAVIDHHMTQDDLKAERFVDVSAEATGRLVYEAITALGVVLTPSAASCLFVALAMDTGWFRHSNTKAATFALAEKLVDAGASPDGMFDRLFEQNSVSRLKLLGLVLDRLQMTPDNRVAYTEILRGDYEATGAIPPDSEDLINYTRSIAGVDVGLLFMEQPAGGVKVSFRSRSRVDVARIAEQFDGGGHRLASGAIIDAPLAEARRRVLAAVQLALSRLD